MMTIEIMFFISFLSICRQVRSPPANKIGDPCADNENECSECTKREPGNLELQSPAEALFVDDRNQNPAQPKACRRAGDDPADGEVGAFKPSGVGKFCEPKTEGAD